MTSFDRLDEVRTVARAKSLEDFEYFANYVLGLRLDSSACRTVQMSYEASTLCALQDKKMESALASWCAIREGSVCPVQNTETLTWLFPRAA